MAETNIEWTDSTWNPIRARSRQTGKVGHYCEMISSGCARCYASAMQSRFGMPSFPEAGKHQEDIEIFLDAKVLRHPLSWKKPRRIFVGSMTDMFGDWVTDEWLDFCFGTMAITTRHTYQLLTKRPERARNYLKGLSRCYDLAEAAERSPVWTPRLEGVPVGRWPIPSVWLGVSIENRKHGFPRIDVLREIPTALRFLSVEPLLEPLGEIDLSGISWVIIGGESGPHRRPFEVEWAADIYRLCRQAEVACFIKQDAGPRPGMQGRIPDELWRVKEFPALR